MRGARQSSANQYDSMQSTIDASKAGQMTPGTIRAASTSMATESAIFANAHHSMLTALTTGDNDESRLVAPRAISAPGTTTIAAPYAADTAPIAPTTSHAMNTATAPIAPCAAMTRHGESTG